MNRRLAYLVTLSVALIDARAQEPASGARHIEREQGYALRWPSATWRVLPQPETRGAHTLMAQDPGSGALFVVVTTAAPAGQSPQSIAAERESIHRRSLGTQWQSTDTADVEVDGVAGKRLVITHGHPDTIIEERLLLRGPKLYVVQARRRKDDAAGKRDVDALFASFTWLEPGAVPEGKDEAPAPVPANPPSEKLPPIAPPARPALAVTRGDAGSIVLVRMSGDFDVDVACFAMSVPFADVSGCPVCLLVGERLTSSQVDLLDRVAANEIVAVGEPPDEIAALVTRRLAQPDELLRPATEAVVTSADVADVLAGVPEAVRLAAPLLIASPALAQDLARLGVKQVRLVAARQPVSLPSGVDVMDVSDPRVRWQQVARAGGDYLAVVNVGAERSRDSGAPIGAALLAARHRGMVLALDRPVRYHYAELTLSDEVPEDVVCAGKVAKGSFRLPEGELPVVVPVVGPLVGLVATDKFGDALLDLDHDGYFDAEDETVAAGEVRVIGGTPYSFSLRLIGAIGTTKFVDAPRTNRAVAITPPAEVLAATMFESLGGGPPPRFVLLAGDHRELPFDYVKDPVYAQTTMHEQELSSDNLYGDPDRNGYLDVAVGRFVSDAATEATAIASRMSAYSLMKGDWRSRSTLIYPCWPDDEIKAQLPIVFASFEALMGGVDLDLHAAGFATRRHLRMDGDLPQVYPDLSGSALILFAHHAGPTTWLFRMQGSRPEEMRMLFAPRSAAAKSLGPGCGVVPPLDGAPVVISAGCDSAGLDYEVRAADALVHAFFEQGAIAYVGNTRAGCPDTEEHLLRATLQIALGLAPSATASRAIGEAFRQGKNYLDFLIKHRGPFRSTPPFEDYGPAMRREWTSLVYYGDPALVLTPPRPSPSSGVQVSVSEADGARTIAIGLTAKPVALPIWIMEQVAIGPLREITALSAAGLCYGSTPWGTYQDAAQPGPVAPGVFLDLALPPGGSPPPEVSLVKGPAWALGPSAVITDARGERRLQLAVDLIRYAMKKPELGEVASEVSIRVK